MNHLKRLAGQFRCYPFWSQLLITIGSVLVLVMIWSACGAGNRSPSFPPPIEKPRLELPSRNGPVLALAFSPSGNNLASGTSDRVARIWDPSKGVVIQAMKGHLGIVTCIAFSSDGRILVTGSTDKTIKLWDIAKGRENRTLAGHTGAIRSIAFSTDGRWLASTCDDRRISLWSIDSGEELRVLERHQDPVNAVAFSPDGNVLASASNDKTVRLWDPATGRLLRPLWPQFTGSLRCIQPGWKTLCLWRSCSSRFGSADQNGTINTLESFNRRRGICVSNHFRRCSKPDV